MATAAGLWEGGRGALGAHEWKQNVLELKSQCLGDQEVSSRPWGPWDSRTSFLCGTACSHSTYSSFWGFRRNLAAHCQIGAEGYNCGARGGPPREGPGLRHITPAENGTAFSVLLFHGNIMSSDCTMNLRLSARHVENSLTT